MSKIKFNCVDTRAEYCDVLGRLTIQKRAIYNILKDEFANSNSAIHISECRTYIQFFAGENVHVYDLDIIKTISDSEDWKPCVDVRYSNIAMEELEKYHARKGLVSLLPFEHIELKFHLIPKDKNVTLYGNILREDHAVRKNQIWIDETRRFFIVHFISKNGTFSWRSFDMHSYQRKGWGSLRNCRNYTEANSFDACVEKTQSILNSTRMQLVIDGDSIERSVSINKDLDKIIADL